MYKINVLDKTITSRRMFMEILHKCALFITILGALIWGVIGIFNFNIVSEFTNSNTVSNTLYTLIGLAGIFNIGLLFRRLEDKNKIRNAR